MKTALRVTIWLGLLLAVAFGGAPMVAFASCHTEKPVVEKAEAAKSTRWTQEKAAQTSSCCASADACACPVAVGFNCACSVTPSPYQTAPPPANERLTLPGVDAVASERLAFPVTSRGDPVSLISSVCSLRRYVDIADSPPRAPPFQRGFCLLEI